MVYKYNNNHRCWCLSALGITILILLTEGTQDKKKIVVHNPSLYYLQGETFFLHCTFPKKMLSGPIDWSFPRNNSKHSNILTRENDHENAYSFLSIENATKDDEGNYTCMAHDSNGKMHIHTTRKVLTTSYIILKKILPEKNGLLETSKTNSKLIWQLEAYPKPEFNILRNNVPLDQANLKYTITQSNKTGDITLTINNSRLEDSGNYTLIAENGYLTKAANYDYRKKTPPTVFIEPEEDKTYKIVNQTKSIVCVATGYPLPKIEWIYATDQGELNVNSSNVKKSLFKVKSIADITLNKSGNLTCKASNTKTAIYTRKILIHEISRGFGILGKEKTWFPENDDVSFKCLASKYDFSNLTWRRMNGDDLSPLIHYADNELSHITFLNFNGISTDQADTYVCAGQKLNGSEELDSINLMVEAKRYPTIMEPPEDKVEAVKEFQQVEIKCIADAVPAPTIEWLKDGKKLNHTREVQIIHETNYTITNSTISIARFQKENFGEYKCLVYSASFLVTRTISLKEVEPIPYKTSILIGVGTFILALLVLVMYLTWKIRKEKQFRKELAAAGLLYFKEGVTKSLNPELGIDEQAELLPYDERFEFPPEKLILGKQLGAGAFGVVYKAEARGIIHADVTTTVAVKMVKKTADNMYIKALASELKIMVHLGKHINIVNLLGACTRKVGKRELIVIVEYCQFGNIHNYMQKHREVFVDQLTDNHEKNMGRVNRGYSCSSGSSGTNSDYFGTQNTQATDYTQLSSVGRSGRKESESSYVQPEWRSNYKSDYCFDGKNRSLCSRDLLAWAFQIARGMEYLASRKVLHGDLAARNILLTEDNVVKICDFGLAKSIYRNDEYMSKGNSPLPVKWLAIECMMDRIFSTQSDVWSFGIVLWEMFSLAKTPYPNMSPQNLLQWLSDGHRLEKPPYADQRVYDVMLRCWERKPNDRPSFTQLQEMLGLFLEENVRNHYIDLNAAYDVINVKKTEGEDYLAMVSAPDYNNLVTPSPHHYINDVRSFFPPTPNQVPLGDNEYAQMSPMDTSIFSPRRQSTKFDFDLNKVTETENASELTPMLTLNNLPARSVSDSDQSDHSPQIDACPKYEEADDVFKPNECVKNHQISAVSNPTYISLDEDLKKII